MWVEKIKQYLDKIGATSQTGTVIRTGVYYRYRHIPIGAVADNYYVPNAVYLPLGMHIEEDVEYGFTRIDDTMYLMTIKSDKVISLKETLPWRPALFTLDDKAVAMLENLNHLPNNHWQLGTL